MKFSALMRPKAVFEAVARTLARDSGVTVRFQGNRACTDGQTITIPAGNWADETWTPLALGYLYHEVGHCRFTDWTTGPIMSAGHMKLARLLEEVAVETHMGREYPGCREVFTVLNDTVLQWTEDPLCSLLVNGKKIVAAQPLKRTPDPQLALDQFGAGVFDCLADACAPGSTTADRQALARLLHDCLEDRKEREQAPSQGDGGPDDRSRGEDASTSADAGDERPNGGGRRRKAGNAPPKEKSGPSETGQAASAQRRHTGGQWPAEAVLKAIREYRDQGEQLAERLEAMHEQALDAGEYLVFSREEDRLEPAPEADSDEAYRQLRERHERLGARFVRLFQSEHAESWVKGRERGVIDGHALAKIKTGYFKVFKQRRRAPQAAHDTAVSFLVDFSGSMRGARIENAMSAVVLFLESLVRAEVACEVLGYTTCGEYAVPEEFRERYGRVDKLLTVIFKSFAEPLSAAVRRRIAGYGAIEKEYTCIVDPLLIACERLLDRPERRRIIFLLTDGAVESNGNDAAGWHELARVVRAIEAEGLIELLAIDLMSGHTQGVFSRRIEVKSSEALPEKLMEGLETHLLAPHTKRPGR